MASAWGPKLCMAKPRSKPTRPPKPFPQFGHVGLGEKENGHKRTRNGHKTDKTDTKRTFERIRNGHKTDIGESAPATALESKWNRIGTVGDRLGIVMGRLAVNIETD